MQEHALQASRVLMGDSLAFHILFVLFGLALPILVSFFELLAIKRKDTALYNLAHKWSKIMALLVITGVISGTIIAFQMTLVWPGILKFGGTVIGLPFALETYAFLVEAIFLALYMFTWNDRRVPKLLHWVFGLFVILGSTASAFMITSVNAWMNVPAGFDFINGKITNVNVVRAMFSPTTFVEFFHSMPGYYLAAALGIAGLYSLKLLRTKATERTSKSHRLDWLVLKTVMIFAAISFVLVAITGDITGKYLAKHEPVKLATIEAVQKTTTNAPFILGGKSNQDGELSGVYLKVPDLLSILAGGSRGFKVTGLEEFKKSERPPAYIHTIFDIKLLAIGAISAVLIGYFSMLWLRPQWLNSTPALAVFTGAGVLGMLVVELGWMITEIGRQPWAVHGYVTTKEALTQSHTVSALAYIFPLSYVALFAVTYIGIQRILRAPKKGVR